ncbi:MAG: helix-turn-helix transcriptional regulator [Acidobacteriota bacterium]|nr:helix-turn-helix transcriptional regulator [Acidobacteriota bacterium]
MKTKNRKLRLLKDKELRNKFLADQIKIGLRYQLRSLRDSQGLTQKDLADLIGTKQSVISRLEKKPERVSIPTLLDIAEVLDVGVVVRFEAIDTVLDWYSNPTQKKMTPRNSEKVLEELEQEADKPQELMNVDLFEGIADATEADLNKSTLSSIGNLSNLFSSADIIKVTQTQ